MSHACPLGKEEIVGYSDQAALMWEQCDNTATYPLFSMCQSHTEAGRYINIKKQI